MVSLLAVALFTLLNRRLLGTGTSAKKSLTQYQTAKKRSVQTDLFQEAGSTLAASCETA
ncbi:hypothetical protein D3C77_269640 [compost metagenome]